MRVYISGKIGEEHLSEATRQKFAKAEVMLRSKGFDVFNPTTSGFGAYAEEFVKNYNKCIPENMCEIKWYDKILLLDLGALASCHAIYLLDDWQDSDVPIRNTVTQWPQERTYSFRAKRMLPSFEMTAKKP